MKHLLDLTEDILIRIISALDGHSILDCREGSSQLAHLVDDTVALQYILELALTGMIDGPPSSATVRDRLDALRAYRMSWDKGEHPVSEVYIGSSRLLFSGNATHVAWSDNKTRELKVYRPAGVFRGIQERREVYEEWKRLCTSRIGQLDFLISSGQDMVMHFWTWGPAQTHPGREYAECTFASLAENFGPHPLAARPTFNTYVPLPLVPPGTLLRMQYLGDLVAWAASGAGLVDMLVMNWKTGTLLWHFRLLTTNHVAVMRETDFTISLYRIDPHASSDCSLLTANSCHCVLQLPPRTGRVRRQHVDSTIGHPPEYSSDTRPLFLNDPSLTVFVVHIALTYTGPRGMATEERSLLFIPIDTVIRLCTGTAEVSNEGRIVPWAEWGPRGTRMMRVSHGTSFPTPLGAQVAVSSMDEERRAQLVTIYEIYPLANTDWQSSIVDRTADRTKSDWLKEAQCWKDPVETTYSLRTTTRLVPYGPQENMMVSRSVWLSHDGLVLVRS
ncbi:hypothetical protein BV20DRAFT_977586 [Pilatotrama ljubarskyi]|nr:hypothetical protein BV20DRAFT_977586 [Pilatotrama ljubarskyi]